MSRVGHLVRARFEPRSGTPWLLYRLRRRRFAARLARRAWLARATVDLDIADDVRLARNIRVDITPGTHSVVRLGPGCRLGPGVYLELKGGTIDFGHDVDVRHTVRLNVKGTLTVPGPSIFAENCTVHCDNEVFIGPMTAFSEQVTITDSSHHHVAPDEWFYGSVKSGTVRFGSNSWVAARAVIARNAQIGDCCIVGGNSVVTGEVPDGHLASGIPATSRPLGYDWLPAAE